MRYVLVVVLSAIHDYCKQRRVTLSAATGMGTIHGTCPNHSASMTSSIMYIYTRRKHEKMRNHLAEDVLNDQVLDFMRICFRHFGYLAPA